MIYEITNYHCKPGAEADVLAHRLKGCELRERLGLARGEVLVLQEGEGTAVRWVCGFADEAAYQADLKARDQSPEFGEQRRVMSGLIERFHRDLYRSA